MDREMKNAVAITKQGVPKAKPEKRKTICNGCKFAEWKRTENGRLHSDGSGHCKWKTELSLPPSAYTGGFGRDFKDGVLTITGRYIWRTDEGSMLSQCAVREPE
jgi:hypothetical protein